MTNSPKNLVIIGSSSGIGYQYLTYSDCYDSVYGVDIIDARESKSSYSNNITFIKCDVSNKSEFEECLLSIFKSLSNDCRWDIVFTAAMHTSSLASHKDIVSLSEQVIKVNFLSHVVLTSILLRNSINARLFVLGSLSATVGLPFQHLYSASKAALLCFYESLDLEFRERNISAHYLRFGAVTTGFNGKGNHISALEGESYSSLYHKSIAKITRNEASSAFSICQKIRKFTLKSYKPGVYIYDIDKSSFFLSMLVRLTGRKFASFLSQQYLVH